MAGGHVLVWKIGSPGASEAQDVDYRIERTYKVDIEQRSF